MYCWDDATQKDFCKPMSEGCPCSASEQKCGADTDWSWCQSKDLSCDGSLVQNYVRTHRRTIRKNAHKPTCTAGEHMCSGGTADASWCQPKNTSCPLFCGSDQHNCWDRANQKERCIPMDKVCPVVCGADEHKCGADTDWPWCEPKNRTCPKVCGSEEINCWDNATQTDSCQPMSKGCPCTADEQLCGADSGFPWCQPKGEPCPVTCSSDETYCWDDATQKDFCKPMKEGCPCNA